MALQLDGNQEVEMSREDNYAQGESTEIHHQQGGAHACGAKAE